MPQQGIRRLAAVFSSVFILLFLVFSLVSFKRDRFLKNFTAVLSGFQSDFLPQSRGLHQDLIGRKNLFVAFGNYQNLPWGVYTAAFHLESTSSSPAQVELQLAADRGRKVIASRSARVGMFPVQEEISFRLHQEKEVEPRVRLVSGNTSLVLEKMELKREGGLFPWSQIGLKALFFSILGWLLILGLLQTGENSVSWKYSLSFFFFFIGCSLILRKAWVSEDAFITLRHVENFISGLGPVFNPGERVEGFTHPLWLGLIALFRRLGLSPKGAVIVPGLAASFASLYLLLFRIRPSWGKGNGPALNPAAAVLVGTSAFIDFGTGGLETSLSCLLLVLYAKFIAEGKWQDKPLLMGFICSLLTLTRPDFAVFLLFLLGLYIFLFLRKRISFGKVILFLSFPLALVGGYQVFRMGYYAALFPNPFYTKSATASHLAQGLKYLFDFIQGSFCGAILALVVLACLLNFRQRPFKHLSLVLFSGLLHGFFVVRGGGDFMHGRFLLPAFVLLTASLSGAFDRFWEKKALLRKVYVLACLGLFFLSLKTIPVQKKGEYYHYGISDERFAYYRDQIVPLEYLFQDTVILMWKTIGRNYGLLSEKSQLNIRIAYKNVGFTGFYAGRHVYVLDQLGLTDPVVARQALPERERPGHEKHAPFGYLMLSGLTFHETPFPIWDEAARTKYGILWNLSPRTLRRLGFILERDFKARLDARIVAFLEKINGEGLRGQADFLFFLRMFWYPYAPDEARVRFLKRYAEEEVRKQAETWQWIESHQGRVNLVFSHLRAPLTARRFFKNIRFALTAGRTLTF